MTLKSDVDQLAADAALFHTVVHGNDTATVDVGGGVLVPSLAKAVKDAAAPYGSATAAANAAAQSAANAQAVVTGGTAQIGGGAGKMSLGDANGNYGYGVVPKTWDNGKAIELGYSGNGIWSSAAGDMRLISNTYHGAGQYKFALAGTATMVLCGGGAHAFYGSSVSGNADDVITWVKNLDVGSAAVSHGVDNSATLGTSAKRWSTVYAGTGTINTSDGREKTPVEALADAELAAAKALAAEIGTYRFLAAVAEKGDAARRHVGMTVQRAIEIMEAHGLNPFAYGFICYDEWGDKFIEHPAVYEQIENEDGTVTQGELIAEAWTEKTQHAGNRYSFRPDELLFFLARGFDARLSALEAA